MHVIQYIAVQADSSDLGFRTVKHHLESLMGNDPEAPINTWFDWFVTGGGRWATNSEANQYNDNYQGDVAHQDDPRFKEYLETSNKFRSDEFVGYLEEARKVNLIELLENAEATGPEDFRKAMDLYPVKKLYEMYLETWGPESYYFDVTHDSTNKIHMKNSIDNGAKNWYLVPVDFHF